MAHSLPAGYLGGEDSEELSFADPLLQDQDRREAGWQPKDGVYYYMPGGWIRRPNNTFYEGTAQNSGERGVPGERFAFWEGGDDSPGWHERAMRKGATAECRAKRVAEGEPQRWIISSFLKEATAGEPLDCATVLWPTDPATWGEDARTRVTTELGLAAPAPPGWVVVPLTNSGGDDAGTGGLLYYNINTHSYYRPQPGPIGNLSARPPADNRPLREDEHASGRGDPDYKAGCVRVVYSVTDGCCRWE